MLSERSQGSKWHLTAVRFEDLGMGLVKLEDSTILGSSGVENRDLQLLRRHH